MARTMKGKHIDMGALASANSHVRAVGNAMMNARGDKVDLKGNVVMTREAIDATYEAYYRENPHAVRTAAMSALESEVMTPDAAWALASPKAAIDTSKAIPTPAMAQTPAPAPAATPAPAQKSKKVLSED